MRAIGTGLVAASLTLALVLSVGHAAGPPACPPSRPDAEGPFYVPNAPERDRTGRGLVVAGEVRSSADCAGLPGARVEWWSADAAGSYGPSHRATQRADAAGRFRYETDFPGRYPGRPPHLHVRVTAPGHRALVTQLYPRPGQTALEVNFVLARE